jgi:hypothetical protein
LKLRKRERERQVQSLAQEKMKGRKQNIHLIILPALSPRTMTYFLRTTQNKPLKESSLMYSIPKMAPTENG